MATMFKFLAGLVCICQSLRHILVDIREESIHTQLFADIGRVVAIVLPLVLRWLEVAKTDGLLRLSQQIVGDTTSTAEALTTDTLAEYLPLQLATSITACVSMLDQRFRGTEQERLSVATCIWMFDKRTGPICRSGGPNVLSVYRNLSPYY